MTRHKLPAMNKHRPSQPNGQPAKQTQPSLFGAPEPASAVLAIPTPAATQFKAQWAFNRLIGQMRQQREELAQWQAYSLRHNQRLATEL